MIGKWQQANHKPITDHQSPFAVHVSSPAPAPSPLYSARPATDTSLTALVSPGSVSWHVEAIHAGCAPVSSDAIGFTIGTGIGGGIIVNGRLYHGASDCAGEIGHTIIDPDGPACRCGAGGAVAAGTAVAVALGVQLARTRLRAR